MFIHRSSGSCFVVKIKEKWWWWLFLSIHTYLLHPGSCECCPSMQWMKGSKHPWTGTPIYHGADTEYHSSRYTLAPSASTPFSRFACRTYHSEGSREYHFGYTCCICLRWKTETTFHLSYRSPHYRVPSSAASVTSCEVTLYIEVQMRRDRFGDESHRHKNSFKHVTASDLVSPVHLS